MLELIRHEWKLRMGEFLIYGGLIGLMFFLGIINSPLVNMFFLGLFSIITSFFIVAYNIRSGLVFKEEFMEGPAYLMGMVGQKTSKKIFIKLLVNIVGFIIIMGLLFLSLFIVAYNITPEILGGFIRENIKDIGNSSLLLALGLVLSLVILEQGLLISCIYLSIIIDNFRLARIGEKRTGIWVLIYIVMVQVLNFIKSFMGKKFPMLVRLGGLKDGIGGGDMLGFSAKDGILSFNMTRILLDIIFLLVVFFITVYLLEERIDIK